MVFLLQQPNKLGQPVSEDRIDVNSHSHVLVSYHVAKLQPTQLGNNLWLSTDLLTFTVCVFSV